MLSLSFIKEIEKIIGRENVLTGEADRQNYAYDAAVLPPVVPGLVVRPTRTDQLGPLIQKCYEEGIPITICGAVSGWLYRKLNGRGGRIYLSLITAMLAGRLVWGLVQFLLAGLRSTTFNLTMFLSGAVTMALPGIILQLILIPVLVVVMERTRIVLDA